MSTNINPDVPVDAGLLEQLANQYFKQVEGGNGIGNLPQANALSHFNEIEFEHAIPLSPQLQIPGNASFIPSSASGAGISPSGIESFRHYPVSDVQGNVPVNDFHSRHVPTSVAGSGISPSASDSNTSFNLADPQTSLPDPHFSDGKVPASVAGKGAQPSLQQKNAEQGSNSGDYSFQDLEKALAAFNTFIPVSQLPLTGIAEASFYFLEKDFKPGYGSQSNAKVPGAGKYQSGISSLQPFAFDANLVKKDFPILNEKVNGKPLIWLDNAATTQKPKQVIDRISYFYEHENSNVHRAAHELAARSTDAYEGAREKVRRFLNAKSTNEIVFVRGTTEAINLVAKSWGEQYLNAGDEIIVSHLEHHANIVPWQQLAEKKNLKIKVIPVDDDGQLLLDEYAKLLSSKTKLVAVTQVSNALGTITPAAQIAAMAHAIGAKVLIDGAQSVSHMRTDVQALNADWFVFSGHKIFGPTGIGVLYGKEELLNATDPWQGGGNMIVDVTFEKTQFHKAPGRFEAGTGNIADAVGLGAALDYVTKIGIDLIGQYEHYLLEYGMSRLKEVPGLKLIGTAREKASVMSFVLDAYTNDEVGQALNKEGIAVRTGHHCAQPILRRFGLESTVRPSLAFYNSCADVDVLVNVLHQLRTKKK